MADYLKPRAITPRQKNGVCGQTVRRVIEESQGITENLKRKKRRNTADILAYMDSRRKQVCDIIEVGLAVLPEKIQTAKTASEVTTAIGR